MVDIVTVAIIGKLASFELGDWADDEEDEWRKDKGDEGKAVDYMMANFLFKTFDNSFRDFNAFSSIGIRTDSMIKFKMVKQIAVTYAWNMSGSTAISRQTTK